MVPTVASGSELKSSFLVSCSWGSHACSFPGNNARFLSEFRLRISNCEGKSSELLPLCLPGFLLRSPLLLGLPLGNFVSLLLLSPQGSIVSLHLSSDLFTFPLERPPFLLPGALRIPAGAYQSSDLAPNFSVQSLSFGSRSFVIVATQNTRLRAKLGSQLGYGRCQISFGVLPECIQRLLDLGMVQAVKIVRGYRGDGIA